MPFKKNNEINLKHGHHRKGKQTPEYQAYFHALDRCQNPACEKYKDYGGRGIQFKFKNFEEFVAHIGLRPGSKHSLDRIKNNGHYEIGNVKWSTAREQIRNRRNSVSLELERNIVKLRVFGHTFKDIGILLGMSKNTVGTLLRRRRLHEA